MYNVQPSERWHPLARSSRLCSSLLLSPSTNGFSACASPDHGHGHAVECIDQDHGHENRQGGGEVFQLVHHLIMVVVSSKRPKHVTYGHSHGHENGQGGDGCGKTQIEEGGLTPFS